MGNESIQILSFIRVGGLLPAALVILGTWVAARVLASFFDRLGKRFTDRRLLLQQITTILRFLIYFAGIVTSVLLAFHLSREMLLAVGGTMAVAVGIAFKDLAASVIAGLLIIVDRPFQVGDRITIGDMYGEVTKIGLRSVRIVTLDDSMVTVPNNKFLNDIVTSGNAGALDMQIVMDFHIGMDQDIDAAKAIVRDAITSSRYTYLGKPWTVLVNTVIQENYFAVRIRGKAYVLDVQYEKAYESDVTERVLQAFRERYIAPPAILHRSFSALPSTAPTLEPSPQVSKVA